MGLFVLAQPHVDSRDNPRPFLPVIWVDLIDKAPVRLALILEADMGVSLRLGFDLDDAEINSSFPGTPCQPDVCFIGHAPVLILVERLSDSLGSWPRSGRKLKAA